MLHTGQAATVADRLVDRVCGGTSAELFAIPGAEPLDAVLVEQGFGRWHEREGLG